MGVGTAGHLARIARSSPDSQGRKSGQRQETLSLSELPFSKLVNPWPDTPRAQRELRLDQKGELGGGSYLSVYLKRGKKSHPSPAPALISHC